MRPRAERARMRWWRALSRAVLIVISTALVIGIAAPVPVWAHAGLVTATPSPGSGAPQPPGEAVLRFDEPLNYRLSSIRVDDASGVDVATGPTRPVEGDLRAMRRKLGLLAPGVYTVRWTTVSTLDGHTLKGSYRFGVGTSSAAEDHVADGPLDSEGPLGLIGRLVSLVGMSLWMGVSLLLRRASASGAPVARLRGLARAAPTMALAGGALSIISSAWVASGSPLAVGAVVSSGSGTLRAGSVIAGAFGAIAGYRRGASVLLATSAIAFEATSGHAAATAAPALASVSFLLHLSAVGVWIFAVAAAVISPRGRIIDVLWSLTPWAIGAAVLVAATGAINAAFVLGSPKDLIGTGYGKTLVLKGAAFVAMAGFGIVHHRRRRRREEVSRIEAPLRYELVVAALALILATALVGFPNPPREAASAELGASVDPFLLELPDAVSFAEASGPFIAGVSFIPPRPGEVEIRVQLLGIEAGDGPRGARVVGETETGDFFRAPLKPCGRTIGCFSGTTSISSAGTWTVKVEINTNRAPIQTRSTIDLPAPRGRALLERAVEAMESLSSAAMSEHLKGSEEGPEVVSSYRFKAPDRFEIKVRDAHRIAIGTRSFRKEDPGSPWEESTWPGDGFSWPQRYYRDFWRGARAVSVLGTGEADGVPSTIVSFVRPDLPAWFRLWVGADGLVRRQEMRAQGHIMDHVISQMNAPIDIEPPI